MKRDSARLKRVVGRVLEVRASSDPSEDKKLRIVGRVIHALSLIAGAL